MDREEYIRVLGEEYDRMTDEVELLRKDYLRTWNDKTHTEFLRKLHIWSCLRTLYYCEKMGNEFVIDNMDGCRSKVDLLLSVVALKKAQSNGAAG